MYVWLACGRRGLCGLPEPPKHKGRHGDDIHGADDLGGDPCSADELRRMNKMKFYVDRRLKQGSSDDSFLIEKLSKTLEEKVKEIQENKKDGEKYDAAATIIADADIPFRVVAEVIYTAAMVKIQDMRFALLQRESR